MERLSFTMNSSEVKHLMKVDDVLKKLIEKIGSIYIPIDTQYYQSLVKQIIGQQLSLVVAGRIISRVEAVWNKFDIHRLSQIEEDVLRSTGLSRSKITYIKDLTEKVLNGDLDFEQIKTLNDEQALKELMKVKGIGPWTAEMFLIFSLGRLNILSFKDVSIQNAIRWLYQIPKDEEVKLQHFYEKWYPYNTVASLYLWEGVDQKILTKEGIQ